MVAYGVVIILSLAGQVGPIGDRYSEPSRSRQAASDSESGNPSATGLVPVTQPPPAKSRNTDARLSPLGGEADPYGAASVPAENQRSLPSLGSPSGVASPSPPPDFGAFPSHTTPPTDAAATPPKAAGLKPTAMMRAMLKPPRESRLTGQPVDLFEAVSGAATRAEQTQHVEAYWDLCSSIADYYLGLREQQELRQLRSQLPRVGQTWQQAEAELAARIATAERSARASQFRVANLMGGSETALALPLPLDVPHCGDYKCHYEAIFAGRPSTEAAELAALLPQRYAELKDAATAVTRAEEWLDLVATPRTENSEGVGALRALELLALRRRAFVQIARDYNRRIARYSELATPGPVTAERLVGMLIMRDAATATRSSSPTAPPNRQSRGNAGMPPPTFARGWEPANSARSEDSTRDDEVRPTSAESGVIRERSLLVRPR